MIVASPFPRLGAQALDAIANAAGYALACPYENSAETHAEAISKWRRAHRAATLRSLPSPVTFLLAAILVVL